MPFSSQSVVGFVTVVCLGLLATTAGLSPTSFASSDDEGKKEKLTVVWTSGDPEVAHRMVLMYGAAAKKNQWFDEVRVVIWGPSARLTASDKDIQAKLAEMKDSGVVLQACVVCADSYGVSDRLRELGIEVKPMGKPLSDTLKDSTIHTVTF